MKNIDEKFMNLAYLQAQKALLEDEVPVGCVIVKDNKVIARAYNKRENKNSSTAHAEILAIQKACKKLNSWRLIDCTLYVTLEPCPMCAGAIILSRIDRVVFGALDPKGGAIISNIHLFDQKNLNHHPKVTYGVKNNECSSILTNYFKSKRK